MSTRTRTYPAAGRSGKFHAAQDGFVPLAACPSGVLLDLDADPILVVTATPTHPVVCRICLAMISKEKSA